MIKRKSALIILVLIILSTFILIAIPSCSYAEQAQQTEGGTKVTDPTLNPDLYKPGKLTENDTKQITGKANQIIGIIVTVGTVASVITLAILGIKYMIGSVEEKAEYKKSMMPYLIGAVLLFASSTVVNIIAQLMQGTSLNK